MKLELQDGTEIEVEPTIAEGAFEAQGLNLSDVKASFSETIQSGGVMLKESIETLKATLEKHAPDELEIQLGLKIGAEGNVILAKGTAEAAISLKATWKK